MYELSFPLKTPIVSEKNKIKRYKIPQKPINEYLSLNLNFAQKNIEIDANNKYTIPLIKGALENPLMPRIKTVILAAIA